MEDAVCFLFFVLQTIRHLTAVFVATQSDIYSREVSFMVIKYCISIQHRIFSPTSCFCVMSTFTLMIGSLNITTTFVTCVCLIGSVIQVVLDHLGTSAPLHRSRTSVSAASNKGNHSLRREALLTGRSSTEPSERGRDLLTLHKLSDILLSCPLVSVSSWTYSQTLYYKFTLKRVEERHRNNICLQDSFFVLFLLLVCSFCSPVHTCFIYLMLKKHIDKKYVCL